MRVSTLTLIFTVVIGSIVLMQTALASNGVGVEGGVPGRIMLRSVTSFNPNSNASALVVEGGEQAFATVVPSSPGLYRIYVRAASVTGAQLTVRGKEDIVLQVPNTGGRDQFVTLSDYIYLDDGEQVLTLEAEGSATIQWLEILHILPGTVQAEACSGGKQYEQVEFGNDERGVSLNRGGTLEYLADTAASGKYNMEFRVKAAGGTFEIREDGIAKGIVRLPSTNGSLQTVTQEISLRDGRHVMQLVSQADKWSLDYFSVTRAAQPLHIIGNKITDPSGNKVRLLGVNVPSLEWTPTGEMLLRSCTYVYDNWCANVIRMPISAQFWADDTSGYRDLLRQAVSIAEARGKYVILDMHEYVAPTEDQLAAWKEIAKAFANNPSVLFGLLNEPHDTSWTVWKDGGTAPGQDNTTFKSVGLQAIADGIRATGAGNIMVIGGVDWAYDLRGIKGKYAVADPLGQVIYDTHPYPWKAKPWDSYVTVIAAKYPVLAGEFGCDPVNDPSWVPNYPGGAPKYMSDMLQWLDKNEFNATAWCFHPTAGPILVKSKSYEPSEFSGSYIRDWLYAKGSIDSAKDRAVTQGKNWLMTDLGAERSVRRWVLRCGPDSFLRTARHITLQVSDNGKDFANIDTVSVASREGDWAGAFVDRVVTPFKGRYVRLLVKGTEPTTDGCTSELWQ